MSKDFSERLVFLRGTKKKAEFARELGIPAPMYHRYENGQIPQYDNLKVISDATGKSVDWLLTGQDDVKLEIIRTNLQIELHVARKCLGKTFHDLAKIMDVKYSDLESVAAGKSDPTRAFSEAFETKIVPLQEAFDSSLRQKSDFAMLHEDHAQMYDRLSAIEQLLIKLTGK